MLAPAATTLAVVAAGMALPFTPLAPWLGFAALPPAFFGVLAAMVVAYLALMELGKSLFFRARREVIGEGLPAEAPT